MHPGGERSWGSPDLDAVAARLAEISPRPAPTKADAILAAKEYVKQLYRSLHDQGLIEANDFASLIRYARGGGAQPEPARELRPKNAYKLLRLIHVATGWLRTGAPELEMKGAVRERLLAIKRGEVGLDVPTRRRLLVEEPCGGGTLFRVEHLDDHELTSRTAGGGGASASNGPGTSRASSSRTAGRTSGASSSRRSRSFPCGSMASARGFKGVAMRSRRSSTPSSRARSSSASTLPPICAPPLSLRSAASGCRCRTRSRRRPNSAQVRCPRLRPARRGEAKTYPCSEARQGQLTGRR